MAYFRSIFLNRVVFSKIRCFVENKLFVNYNNLAHKILFTFEKLVQTACWKESKL